MFRKNKILFLAFLASFGLFSFCHIYNTPSVFAHTASITTSGTVNLTVSPSGNGASVATDNLEVTSTCPLGYTVSIQGPADATLYKDGDKANDSISSKIIPTNGTKANPLPIIGDDGSGNSYLGTWGYSMVHNTATGTFIGLNNNLTEIYTKSTASGNGQTGAGATTTDTIPVYYGVSVDINKTAGVYKLAESSQGANDGVITYSLITNPACDAYTVKFNSNGGAGEMADQLIYEDVPTALAENAFTFSGATFSGWTTNADGTGDYYADEEVVTNLATPGQTIELYAKWIKSAFLEDGYEINTKLKSLASGNVTGLHTEDNFIKSFVRFDTLPANFTPTTENTISVSDSPAPVYVWFDSVTGTMYYYSEAETIYASQRSERAFYYMRSLANISGLADWNTSRVDTMSEMFSGTQISDLTPIKDWDVSGVSNMFRMFWQAKISDLTGLENWNVSNVTDMRDMFDTTQISDLTPITNWNVSNVTNMHRMFYYTQISNLTPIANWKVDNVTNMGSMFYHTQISNLTPIANWKVDNVTNMGSMFYHTQISDLTPIKDWRVDNVTDMGSMFSGTQISDLTPIKDWKVDNVTSMGGSWGSGMFSGTQISDLTPIADWKVDNVKSMSGMFSGTQISDLTPIANWKVDNVKSMSYMFRSTQISDLTPIKDWKVDNVKGMEYMFSDTQISDLTLLKDWKVDNVTDMHHMFSGTQISDLTPIANWKVDNVKSMSYMFRSTQISDLTPIKDWKVDNVTDMSGMFCYTRISDLTPIKDWKVDNVTDMSGMFCYTRISDLTPIKDWKVDNVTKMGGLGGDGMFAGTQISDLAPIKDWNVSNVTSMSGMFWGTQISDLTPLKDWNVGKVTHMAYMFNNVSTLTNSAPISGWNVNSVRLNTTPGGFDQMFGGTTPKTNLPIFTSRPGTWNTYGTYTPN